MSLRSILLLWRTEKLVRLAKNSSLMFAGVTLNDWLSLLCVRLTFVPTLLYPTCNWLIFPTYLSTSTRLIAFPAFGVALRFLKCSGVYADCCGESKLSFFGEKTKVAAFSRTYPPFGEAACKISSTSADSGLVASIGVLCALMRLGARLLLTTL